MPIYETDELTREKLEKIRRRNICSICGGWLNTFLDAKSGKAFLACNDWPRTHHDGIEREASRYEREGLAALNIPTKEEIMEQEYGKDTTRALDKYMGVVTLTKPQAKEIILAVYPDAPESEIARAVMLCASYGLNPLMKHIFLIKFNRWNKGHTQIIGEDWATVMGIKAKRLLSSRRGSYSYVDNTPRVMTEQEQRAIFGEVDGSKLWAITKVKDPQTSAEAVGYGFWPKDINPHGTEKGNTKFNMASIRSESQALDRLRPGEMPEGIEVVPEEAVGPVIEGEATVIKDEELPAPEPKPKDHFCEEHNCAFDKKTRGTSTWYAHKLPDGRWCNEAKKKAEVPKGGTRVPAPAATAPIKAATPVTEPVATAKPVPVKRKASDIKPEDLPDAEVLERVVKELWNMSPANLWAELNYKDRRNFDEAGVETPWVCFSRLKRTWDIPPDDLW